MKSIVEKARKIVTHLYERNMVSWNDLDREVVFAIQALNAEVQRMEALAQPEQEPVAWVDLLKEAQQIVESKVLWKRFIDGTPLSNDIACWMADFAQQHTTPPQRTWVGLTEREQGAIMEDLNAYGTNLYHFAQAIEAKLKEKNT